MKNPCNECLVKVNCTEVCPDKLNLKILLSNAIRMHFRVTCSNYAERERLLFYRDLERENNEDIRIIENRKFFLKCKVPDH